MIEDLDIKTIIPYYEVKGCFGYETKSSMRLLKPIINFSSRFEEVTTHISKVLKAYDIKHNIMFRGNAYHLRMSHITNCHRFTKLLVDGGMRVRLKEVEEMYNYCNKNDKRNKT